MRIGLVGCGFVADNDIKMIGEHPEIRRIGVHDRKPERLTTLTRFHKLRARDSLAAMLADDSVQMVVNLTSASRHDAASKAGSKVGKTAGAHRMDFARGISQLAMPTIVP